MRYEGIVCPVCKQAFTKTDDIVVCPECGTPHHRACYEKNGQCIHHSLHGSSFSFSASRQENSEPLPQQTAAAASGNKLICPVCRHENPPGSTECEFCSQRFTLFGFNVLDKQAELDKQEHEKDAVAVLNEQKEEEKTAGEDTAAAGDGVSTDDITEYVRTNHLKYTKKFQRLSQKKLTWNWAAFLFTPYWFFYRKMIKPGLIFLAAVSCIAAFSLPALSDIADLYSDFLISSSESSATQQQVETLIAEVDEAVRQNMPFLIASALSVTLLRIIAALLADRLYKKRVYYQVRALRKQSSNQETFHFMMYKLGGTSFILVAVSYVFEYVLQSLAQLIMFR